MEPLGTILDTSKNTIIWTFYIVFTCCFLAAITFEIVEQIEKLFHAGQRKMKKIKEAILAIATEWIEMRYITLHSTKNDFVQSKN